MNNSSELIQLDSIYKTYFSGRLKFEALKNISLTIQSGESIAILGPSGSGKSTLMQIIGCLSTPTAGRYWLSGEEVSQLKRNQLAYIRNQKIGFIFQHFNLLTQLTALDNVALPLVYRGISQKVRYEKARNLLAQFNVSEYWEHRPNELSGGQQQRVAIARALITEPEVILGDEPTGNLDSKSGSEVLEIFKQLSHQGKTLILVTHDLSIAKRMQRIIQIKDGQIEKDQR